MSQYRIILLSLFLTSCNPYWRSATPQPLPVIATQTTDATPNSAPVPAIPVTVVTADQALNLRDLPDNLGGNVLVRMPRGSQFSVQYCRDFDDAVWAFGSFTDMENRTWFGWANAKYLKGACDGIR